MPKAVVAVYSNAASPDREDAFNELSVQPVTA